MLGPLFSTLHALAVDDASGGAGLSLRLLAAFDVQCMMDPIQRAVAMPPRKIVMQRAARRKVFWDVPPLAAGAQDVHHAVHDGPHVDPPLTAAAGKKSCSTSEGKTIAMSIAPLDGCAPALVASYGRPSFPTRSAIPATSSTVRPPRRQQTSIAPEKG